MKVVRLNENDIKKLVKRIIKEDGESLDWTKDVKPYDLVGIYIRKPVQKLDGVSGGEVMEVTEVDGLEATVFLSYNLQAILSGYQYSAEGPYYMDVNDLIQDIQDGVLIKYEKPIQESRLFGEPKKTPDERIGEYILQKIEKERPDIQHQFLDYTKEIDNVYGISVGRGVMEIDLFRVDFTNKSNRISKNDGGILNGGDFGIVKVYNVHYKSDVGKRKNTVGYAIKMTGDKDPLNLPTSLVRRIYNKIEEQYGDIRVFKTQRKLDKGTDDESDIFDQLK